MDDLMKQMAELLEQARQEGIDDAHDHLAAYRDSLDRNEYEASYLDGVEDALTTIQELTS